MDKFRVLALAVTVDGDASATVESECAVGMVLEAADHYGAVEFLSVEVAEYPGVPSPRLSLGSGYYSEGRLFRGSAD